MRSPSHVLAIFAAALLALIQLSCRESVTAPVVQPEGERILDSSFERDGQPTLEGWRITNASLTSLVPDPAPGGGKWSLQLDADWAPTTGFVTVPIPGIRDGDVLRLSAFVRAVDAQGGGMIGLRVGPSLGWREKCAFTGGTSWARLSVQDTVSLAPGDTAWVVLSSPHTEVARRQGHFDRVELRRIGTPR